MKTVTAARPTREEKKAANRRRLLEAARELIDRKRGADGPVGMIRMLMGRAEEGNHPIAEELGHCAYLFGDRRAHALEIGV